MIVDGRGKVSESIPINIKSLSGFLESYRIQFDPYIRLASVICSSINRIGNRSKMHSIASVYYRKYYLPNLLFSHSTYLRFSVYVSNIEMKCYFHQQSNHLYPSTLSPRSFDSFRPKGLRGDQRRLPPHSARGA